MNTQTREEQKAVLDAAWNGEETEWMTLSGAQWVRMSDGPIGVLIAIRGGYTVRIKPKPDPYAELKAAHAAGKVIEYLHVGAFHTEWTTLNTPSWVYPVDHYRIRHEPELVPLEASDIPPGSAIRNNPPNPYAPWWIVTMVTSEGVTLGPRTSVNTFCALMSRGDEIKRPGEDWNPCSKPKP